MTAGIVPLESRSRGQELWACTLLITAKVRFGVIRSE
jgi:hypothetical protein